MKSTKYYREFIEQNSEGIFRIDFGEPISVNENIDVQCELFFKKGFVAEFNNSFSQIHKLFSENSLVGQKLIDLQADFEILNKSNIRKFFESGFRLDDFETFQTDKTGQQKCYKNNLFGVVEKDRLVSIWLKMQDITDQKIENRNSIEREKFRQQTQKVEALGRLAGGIAHDFNNFLAVMMLHNDMLNLQLPAKSPLRHRVDEMKKATNNAAAKVKQLLAIGRKQTINPKPTDLNYLISEFCKILPTIIANNIELKLNLETNPVICLIDRKQLIQSLANLAVNASEAMPDGGILSIETANVFLDKNSVRHKSQTNGSFVQITFSDNGTGMDAATLESVFEPFFSTKKSAKGVGLGLATVYGFVKQSKGFIWVESEPDRGTTFKIQFPCIDQPKL